MTAPIQRIAISTGGGDAPGLNAVIRATVSAALRRGWECVGIRDGYNSLLQNNARRHIQRLALRAEYSWPLAAQARRGWHMALGLEWQRQHSSIVLFQQKSRGAYLALRTAW